MRLLWAALGWTGLGLAVVGTVLPIMPTVPFLLLAAFGFARSSPAWHAWLMRHPRFGAPLIAWQRHGAISRPVKVLAIASMAVGVALGGTVLPPRVWLVQMAIIAAVALFVVIRPAPPP